MTVERQFWPVMVEVTDVALSALPGLMELEVMLAELEEDEETSRVAFARRLAASLTVALILPADADSTTFPVVVMPVVDEMLVPDRLTLPSPAWMAPVDTDEGLDAMVTAAPLVPVWPGRVSIVWDELVKLPPLAWAVNAPPLVNTCRAAIEDELVSLTAPNEVMFDPADKDMAPPELVSATSPLVEEIAEFVRVMAPELTSVTPQPR
ncbi:MAG: hypothetical protein IPK39_04450 [Sulfuritalea sp.]|nr:hypothetical protein [Sulfuritalea sp.]